MSLGARATKGGAKGKDRHAQDKGKSDKPQPKEKSKPQATTEQLRMANMIDRKSTDDAADVRKMVQDLMEMTCRTEEEVCSALHDTDNDVVAACNLLLETEHEGEWQTREKKKKKPPAVTNNGDVDRDREPRSRSGPRPPRRGSRERGEGGGRGRGGGRGGRGGRGGARGGVARGARPRPRHNNPDWSHHHSNDANQMGDSFPATEDWDNEEWSGSLSDTKVFTPSATAQQTLVENEPAAQTEDWETNPVQSGSRGVEGVGTYTYHNTGAHHGGGLEPPASAPVSVQPALVPPVVVPSHADHTPSEHFLHHTQVTSLQQPMGMSGSLSAAQSQYLSQLTAQSQRHESGAGAGAGVGVGTGAGSPYVGAAYGVYGTVADITQRKTQRARVPPPSKIPSSAVEMPGDESCGTGMFLDVQFGALEPEALTDSKHGGSVSVSHSTPLPAPPEPAPTQPPAEPAPSQPQVVASTPSVSAPVYTPSSNSIQQLNDSLSSDTSTSQPSAASDSAATVPSVSLEKQLVESMKQLETPSQHHYGNAHSRTTNKQTASIPASSVSTSGTGVAGAGAGSGAGAGAGGQPGAQNVYHHASQHHVAPAVYPPNVYAQVNSNNASLGGGNALAAAGGYPSSVTLTQYQPMLNSYQTSTSVGAYNTSTLYTGGAGVGAAGGGAGAAGGGPPTLPYSYTPHHHHNKHHKDNTQYDNSSVAATNSLTSTSTAQTSTAKVATTTGHTAGVSTSSVTGVTGATGSSAQYAAAAAAAGAAQLYSSQYYDDQVLRSTMPHHMGGYYEVGYGGREGTFGLGAGERFGRTDAASPQQVPAAALPPGYAYFYQPPPPTTYQYGVYPTYGGGSSVGAVSGVSGVAGVSGVTGVAPAKVPAYQQQQYDAQDNYKQGGVYSGSSKGGAGAATADLTNAMYAKTHVALNKVNSYEKAAFHSGTPPPFGAASHLYIPAPPHHHHHHQMDVRMNNSQNRRQESGSSGARSASKQPAHSKPSYSHSYWPPN